MTGYTYRKVDIEKVYNFSNTIETDGYHLIDSLDRIIKSIDDLKQEKVIEGEVGDVLGSIAGDAYQTIKQFQKSISDFAQKVKTAADKAKELDEKYSKEMLNARLLSGVNYTSNSNNIYKAYVDDSKNIKIEVKNGSQSPQAPGNY